MAAPEFKEIYYAYPSVVKSVNAALTSTTPASLWTPASGKKFRVMGWQLACWVGTNVGSLPVIGDAVVLYDSVVTAKFGVIGHVLETSPLAGSILHGSQQDAATFAPSGVGGGPITAPVVNLPYGYTSTAADNVLKCTVVDAVGAATIQDISTCTINVVGTIWGHEV